MKVPSRTRFGLLRTSRIPVIVSLTAAVLLPNRALAQADLQTPEGLIEEIYRLVTFPAGTTPDWDAVRSLFIPEATVGSRDRAWTAFS